MQRKMRRLWPGVPPFEQSLGLRDGAARLRGCKLMAWIISSFALLLGCVGRWVR